MQGNTSGITRAEVKSQAPTAETDRKNGTTGELIKPNTSDTTQGNTSGTTRADVKAQIGTEPRRLSTGEVAGGSTVSSAERKRMRDERRAAAKAKREEAKMKSGGMTPAPASEKAR